MDLKSRRRVGLLVETSRAYGRELLQGVALFARTHADWSLLHQEMTLDSVMPQWMMSSVLSGLIARVDTHTVDPLRALHVPIVDVRCNRELPDIPQVDTDNRRVAELAFQHLWDRGVAGRRPLLKQELLHLAHPHSSCPRSILECNRSVVLPVLGTERGKPYEVDGVRHYIDLSDDIDAGRIQAFDVELAKLQSFRSQFDPLYVGELDPGELEALAFLCQESKVYLISSGDAIVYRWQT